MKNLTSTELQNIDGGRCFKPSNPCKPVNPCTPVKPVKPVNPCKPCKPCVPCTPDPETETGTETASYGIGV